jgi:hypothetical protein
MKKVLHFSKIEWRTWIYSKLFQFEIKFYKPFGPIKETLTLKLVQVWSISPNANSLPN